MIVVVDNLLHQATLKYRYALIDFCYLAYVRRQMGASHARHAPNLHVAVDVARFRQSELS